MTEDLKYYKLLTEKASKERDIEIQAAREAATVAVKANIRRSELEEETTDVLNELIDIKMQYAETASDRDAEIKKNFQVVIYLLI